MYISIEYINILQCGVKYLRAVGMIKQAKSDGQFITFIPYGGLGIGKTTWAIKVFLELYYGKELKTAEKMYDKDKDKPKIKKGEPVKLLYLDRVIDYGDEKKILNKDDILQRLSRTLFFKPHDMLERLDEIAYKDERQLLLICDDAGAHMNSLDWYKPYVKAMGKYMDLARTQLTSIIMTAPQPRRISSRIRTIPDTRIVRITKGRHSKIWREAYYMKYWFSPDGKRYGYGSDKKETLHDLFICHIPQFIYKWYMPQRKQWVDDLRTEVKRELEHDLKYERSRILHRVNDDGHENSE